MSLLDSIPRSSKRQVEPLQDSDYDHEIRLVDSQGSVEPVSDNSSIDSAPAAPLVSNGAGSSSTSRSKSKDLTSKAKSLRKEIAARRLSKYQENPEESLVTQSSNDGDPNLQNVETTSQEDAERGRSRSASGAEDNESRTSSPRRRRTEIDILYENERGGFLCGMPLFSGRALGNLDPSPWTSTNMKTSPTDIHTKQVPDPSWEWVWPEWRINHDTLSDKDGWEYSFAFHKWFSWHNPKWWNSFVRRRAWIRRRAKKLDTECTQDRGMLDLHYFTVAPREGSTSSRSQANRESLEQLKLKKELSEAMLEGDITDMEQLMFVLKSSRIDREKMEAVENFLQNGGGELFYLQEKMHDIMGQFIFQASRRTLLVHISRVYEEAEKASTQADAKDAAEQRRLQHLEAAVKAADKEVRSLEFWSDIKELTEEGLTKGGTDPDQGWTDEWSGLDKSGPSDEIKTDDVKSVQIEIDPVRSPSLEEVTNSRKAGLADEINTKKAETGSPDKNDTDEGEGTPEPGNDNDKEGQADGKENLKSENEVSA